MIDNLKADLRRDEGLRLKPYYDTVGKTTIGYGRNLDDVGISAVEAEIMLAHDVGRVVAELDRNLPWWKDRPDTVRRALANMAFNLGWPRLSLFRNMLHALAERDYERAAEEALDSKWAIQVGDRAERIAGLFREAAVNERTVT